MAAKNENILRFLTKRMLLMQEQFPAVKRRFFLVETKDLVAAIVKRTPVDTGRLRAAWHAAPVRYEDGKWIVSCTNNVEYARFVEYGHRWVKGAGGRFKKLEDFNPEKDKAGFTKGKFMGFHGVEDQKQKIKERWKKHVSSWLSLYSKKK